MRIENEQALVAALQSKLESALESAVRSGDVAYAAKQMAEAIIQTTAAFSLHPEWVQHS